MRLLAFALFVGCATVAVFGRLEQSAAGASSAIAPVLDGGPSTEAVDPIAPPSVLRLGRAQPRSRPSSMTSTADGVVIDHASHDLRATISGRGVAIGEATVAVQAWGRVGQALTTPQPGTVCTGSDHVVIQRMGVHEVITTSSTGLRHDIVIEDRPQGTTELVVDIGCGGGRFESKDTGGAELVLAAGRMTYDRLMVLDACGRRLDAGMTVMGGSVRVTVNDVGAQYPVVVDPTISAAGALSTARYLHTSTLLSSGKILVTGGDGASGRIATCEVYDPAVGAWSATAPLATTKSLHSATLLQSGLVLVTGGYDSSGSAIATCELYDPTTGSWTATGSLVTARYSHTSTLLPSGKVLVTGGARHTGSLGKLATCEIYDPTSGTWSATGALATPRCYHTITSLPSGTVLAAGGEDNVGFLATCEVYDPGAGTWRATGPLATARVEHTSTLLPSGKVLVAGGGNSGDYYRATCELYDPVAGTWSATGPLAIGRSFHAATVLPSGKVLVTGGGCPTGNVATCEIYDPSLETWSASSMLATARYAHLATLMPSGVVLVTAGVGSTGHLSTSETYDPTAGTWSPTGSLATARLWHTSTPLPSGKVLVVGGGDSTGRAIPASEIYDPAAGSWIATPLTIPRQEHTATLLPSGKVLVAGGQGGHVGFVFQDSSEIYDATTGTWSATGSLTAPRSRHTSALLPTGRVLVTGGQSGGGYLATSEVYAPGEGTWSTTGSMAIGRRDHTTTLLPSGKVLVAGGYGGSHLAACELYDPGTGTWSATGSMMAARSYHTSTLLPSGKVLVTGGAGTSGVLVQCELYDPIAGTWSATGMLGTERYSHTATLLPSGKVLVTGGSGYTQDLAICEEYDPCTGNWRVTGSLAAGRLWHTSTLLPSGRVLVAGGGNYHITTSEVYDPVNYVPHSSVAITAASLLGRTLTITGTGFAPSLDASSDGSRSSTSNTPVVIAQRVDNGWSWSPMRDQVRQLSDTTCAVVVPSEMQPGPYLLRVVVNGISSSAYSATLDYSVAYAANGGSGAIAVATKVCGVDMVLSNGSGFTRAGHTFTGWNTVADGSGMSYAPGAVYATDAAMTLYAQWLIHTYTVAYAANGGSGAIPAVIKDHGVNLMLSDGAGFIREGHVFTGWNTSPDGTGTSYAASGSYTADSAVTLYAQWVVPNSGSGVDSDGGGSGGCGAGAGMAGYALGSLVFAMGLQRGRRRRVRDRSS